MASFWSEISKDRERRRRGQRRVEAWVRKETVAAQRRAERADAAASKADRAEEARHAREAGLAEAERCNTALAEELARFAGLLGAVVDLPARTLPFMRRDVSLVEFDPSESDDAEPRPAWADFAPPERGVFGRWKYERAVAAARTAFDRASQDYDRRRAAAQEAARRARPTSTSRSATLGISSLSGVDSRPRDFAPCDPRG